MFALVLCALFVASQGHMCLFSPYQRGGPVSHTDINTKGADPCALTTGPCGGVNASDSEGTSFMQASSPGNFSVFLHHPNTTVERLGHIMDDSDPTFSVYQVAAEIGKRDEGRYILQAVYNTNNPDAPAQFFQCADVYIHGSS